MQSNAIRRHMGETSLEGWWQFARMQVGHVVHAWVRREVGGGIVAAGVLRERERESFWSEPCAASMVKAGASRQEATDAWRRARSLKRARSHRMRSVARAVRYELCEFPYCVCL
jgi:hypothetical protein